MRYLGAYPGVGACPGHYGILTETSHYALCINFFDIEAMIVMRKMTVIIPVPSRKFAGGYQRAAATWQRNYSQPLS